MLILTETAMRYLREIDNNSKKSSIARNRKTIAFRWKFTSDLGDFSDDFNFEEKKKDKMER